jgi:hypothetical protein
LEYSKSRVGSKVDPYTRSVACIEKARPKSTG